MERIESMTAPMELISKQAAIDAIKAYCLNCNNYNGTLCGGCMIDNALIAVEDVKVEGQGRRGKWRHLGGDEWRCTNCGEIIYTEGSWETPTYKYCCECGAKIEG